MAMELQRCLAILEIDADVTLEELRHAYRDLIKVWHPDRFSGNARLQLKAAEKLKQINLAYKALLPRLSAGRRLPTGVFPPSVVGGGGGSSLQSDGQSDYHNSRGGQPRSSASAGLGFCDIADASVHGRNTSADGCRRRIISIASGKGGVGKSNFTINLAIALNRLQPGVLILDADLGMANVDVLCGVTPQYNMADVMHQRRRLEEIIFEIQEGVRIIPGVSGIEQLNRLDASALQGFFRELGRLDGLDHSHTVLIDIGAGMNTSVMMFMLAAGENIVIITPEPTALMDAYALVKTLFARNSGAIVSLVVNMAASAGEAARVAESLQRIVRNFLSREILYLGYILSDTNVGKSVRRQQPYLLAYPHSSASRCVQEIATRLQGRSPTQTPRHGIKGFFKRLSRMLG